MFSFVVVRPRFVSIQLKSEPCGSNSFFFGVVFRASVLKRLSQMERSHLLEQRTNIKFLVKLGNNGQEILQMLNVVDGASSMKRAAIFKWINRFRNGQESVKDEERSGRPKTTRANEMVGKVRDFPPGRQSDYYLEVL